MKTEISPKTSQRSQEGDVAISCSLLLLLAVPARHSAPGGDLVDAPHVLAEAAVGGESGRADGAGKGFLARVLPLVRRKRSLVPDSIETFVPSLGLENR